MAAPVQPIIIIKKKGGHGGHHGGAWKVAYADFVTAMMALFIVLWLMHASPEVQKAVGGYFKDPKGRGSQTGTNLAGAGLGVNINKDNVAKLKEKLQQAVQKSPEFQKLKDNVQMTITGEGLRIELVESEKGTFFESGQPLPTVIGSDLIVKLAQELGKIDSPITLEGHTDSSAYGKAEYSNWELSADRANAARRIMQRSGIKSDQITQVRGFADRQPRLQDKPDDPSNRRVSIIVQYQQADGEDEKPGKAEGKEEKGEGEKSAEGGKHAEAESKGKGEKAEEHKSEAHEEAGKGKEAKPEAAKQPTHAEGGKAKEAKAEPAKPEPAKAEPAKAAAHGEADKGHEAKAEAGKKH